VPGFLFYTTSGARSCKEYEIKNGWECEAVPVFVL